MKSTLPFGSWPSQVSSQSLVEGALGLSAPELDRGVLYWLEARPSEGGRQVVMRQPAGSSPAELTPPDVNVRTRVHEYGGGSYLVRDGALFFVDFGDQGLRTRRNGRIATLGTPGSRYADFDLSPDGRWLLAVEEIHREGAEAENRIVALPATGEGEACVVAQGHDFVSFPRFAPDGRRIAYTAWNHPNMPWDGTHLFVQAWSKGGPAGSPREVAGGPSESIFQPRFGPDGTLTFVSDRTGFWNIYALRDSEVRALCTRELEFGWPQWGLGMSSYAFADADTILCRYGGRGGDRLARLRLASGRLEDVELPVTAISGVQAEGGTACFVGASPTRAEAIFTLDLASGRLREHRVSLPLELDDATLSLPQEIEFPSGEDRAYGFFYPPKSATAEGPAGERPPLIVKTHGGPTSATPSTLNLQIQYWTTRGFALVDVNYRGSTGYGRAYRELLRGQWGIVDVEDCVNAALHLAADGQVDRSRLAIRGGSAGGYTTLCALTFRDVFHAGASHYGIGDLEALARDTHKFESRYLEGLIGPYPERRDLYLERSPIHFCDRLSCPVIFFQGLEDEVVPPNQAEAMVEALSKRRIPHAYVAFPGEQHGFRRAENIRTAVDGELYFYSEVFGFQSEVHPPQVNIVR